MLCASKGAKQSVLQHCHRILTLRIDMCQVHKLPAAEQLPHVSSIADWALTYGSLVKHLIFESRRSQGMATTAEVEPYLSKALQSPSMQLEGLSLLGMHSSGLLQHTKPQHLTTLEFRALNVRAGLAPWIMVPVPDLNMSRLTSFTSLRSLSVSDLSTGCMLPPLSSLTSLTAMAVMHNDLEFQQKQQQQELHLPSSQQHLQLTSLPLGRIPSFLNLSSLQTLTLQDPQCSPQELLSLNALPQLQQLAISYAGVDEDYVRDEHSPVFGSLRALRKLQFEWADYCNISAGVAAGIAASTSLTSLSIACYQFDEGVDVGPMLQPLQQLKSLTVKAFGTDPSSSEAVPYWQLEPLASLAGASRSLTALTSLTFCWPMRLRALIEVYSMTQLQQLFLAGSNVHDEGLDVIAHNMPKLRVLGVGNSFITQGQVQKILRKPELLPELHMLVLAMLEWQEFKQQDGKDSLKACRPALVLHVYEGPKLSWWMDRSA